MSEPKRITVIGAGIVGVACALELQRRGFAVEVVDRLPPGEACSFGNAGILAAGSCVPLSMPGVLTQVPGMLLRSKGPLRVRWRHLPTLFPWLLAYVRNANPRRVARIAQGLSLMTSDAVPLYQRLVAGTAAEDLIRTTSILYAYPGQPALDRERAVWALRAAHGTRFELLRDGEVREHEPAVSPAFTRGMLVHDYGYCRDPAELTKALAGLAEAAGAKFYTRDVVDLVMEGNQPRRLITDHGEMEVERLLIAAGIGSARFARRLGFKIPLEAERGYHVTVRNSNVRLSAPVGYSPGGYIATPMAMGLRIAGTVELATPDAAPDYDRATAILQSAGKLFSTLEPHRLAPADVTYWMGRRPSLPDSLPVIGAANEANRVFFAFGHQHLGLTSAPRTARWVADLVIGRRPNVDLGGYAASRFA